MKEYIISKQEFTELMRIKGKVRAVGMKSYADFILKEEGEEGLKKLENVLAELGYSIKFKEIRAMDFYPLGILVAMLVAIKRLFNYDDRKFREMGRFHTKASLLIKLFVRYFFSIERVLKELPKMWRKHLTVGDLKVAEYNKEKKYIILRLENYHCHPLHCQILIGYLPSALKMIIGNEGICEETKCIYKGDECHEFLVKW